MNSYKPTKCVGVFLVFHLKYSIDRTVLKHTLKRVKSVGDPFDSVFIFSFESDPCVFRVSHMTLSFVPPA